MSDSFFDAPELSRLDNPAVRSRCVKLKRRSDLQKNLAGSLIFLLIAAFFLLVRGYAGSTSRSGRYSPPVPALIPYGFAALGVAVAALTAWLGIRNYYLLDPVEHLLYHHFRFFGWRRRRIVFRPGEVLGVTAEGEKRSSKGGAFWVYRLVAVGVDGRKEPLSDWRREGLNRWNAEAPVVAAQLGCRSFAAPPGSGVSVDATGAAPTMAFSPAARTWFPARRVVLLLLLIAIPLAILLYHRFIGQFHR